jgi:hypothetical protein
MGEEHGTELSTVGLSVERIARNDATFREANEGIRDVADREGIGDVDPVPFVCECADPGCRELVRLSLEEYGMIRADPRLFVNVPGHEASAQGWAEVVARRDGHVVVEKVGRAGDIAVELEDENLLPPPRRRP